MKAKVLLFFGVMLVPVMLNAQNDYWIQKGYDAPNSKEKIECFTKSIEKEGATVEAYFCRASAELEIKDFQSALRDYSKIIELDSTDAGAYYSRGFAEHFFIQDYKHALSDYTRAFEIDSTNAQYVYLMARLYMEMKDYPHAIICYKKVLKLNLRNLTFIGISMVSDSKAVNGFNKLMDLQTDSINCIIGLALSYYYTNDPENARKYLKQAKELKPVLKQGVKGFEAFKKEGRFYSAKDDKALKKMFKKLK